VMRDGGGSTEADRLLVEGGRIWMTVSTRLCIADIRFVKWSTSESSDEYRSNL
jgi:hypothetical protein